jgi:uncharacterized membrane-anchored protein
MKRLADLLGRIPRPLLYIAVAAIQVALIAMMVVERARLLREGSEVTLATRPVDPRDFLRGDYVVLNYDISSLPAGALKDTPADGKASVVYVKLAPKDGIYGAVSVHTEPVAVSGDERLIRGRVNYGTDCGAGSRSFCDTLQVKYGIERYFVPEGEGREIEKARNRGKVTIVAAVTREGRAAIKRLLVDGQPVYDEPIY